MKRIIFIITIIILVGKAYAQQKWTLEECIQYAVEHNISVQQIELQRQNAEIDLNTSQMSRLPNLNASMGQDWSFGRTPTKSGLYENTNQSSTSLSISTSIPLFTGFRINNEIAQNKLTLEAATQNLEKAKEDLSLNIAYLYLEVLFKKELLSVAGQQAEYSREQVSKTKALVDAGKVPLSQLYDIEAQVSRDEVSVIEADNALKLALLDLAQSLELENEQGFDIYVPEIDNAISQYTSSVQPVGMVYSNALNVKPVVKAQEYYLESSKKTLEIAKSGYYPQLSLSAGYGVSYYYIYKGDVENNPFADQFRDNGREYVGLSLSIPIFNRFSTRNQVRSAKLNIINQELTLENTKKALYKDIQTAYLNATAAQEKYLASNKAVRASEESFKYAQERYEIGKSTVFEFNEAKNRLVQVQSEAIQAKYDYIFRAKILDFYNGIPIKL